MAPRTILDLPDELLLQLPGHMRNIEDFMNASSTCKRLRSVFADTLPKKILHLAIQSAPTFFSPHPHFLTLAVARQVSAWAVAVESARASRTQRLVEALRGGVPGILDLALSEDSEGVGLTMQDVRRMHELRFRVINPLNDTVDAMVGSAWYAQPNFWDGGAEDAFTLDADVDSATMQLLLYGELFGATMESYLRPAERLPGLGVDVRVEFVKYCIPDFICDPDLTLRHDGFQVLAVGPYAKDKKDEDRHQGNQVALAHMLGGAMFEGTLWKRAWRRVLVAAGALENDDGDWPERWRNMIQKMEYKNVPQVRDPAADYGSSNEEEANEGNDEVGTVPEGVPEDVHENSQAANEGDAIEGGAEVEADEAGEERVANHESDSDNDEENENIGEVQDDEEEGEDEEAEEEEWEHSSQDTEARAANGNHTDLEHLPGNWRFKLFWCALAEVGGLNTFEMVAQFKGREAGKEVTMKPEWKTKILQIRDQVLALKDEHEPGHEKFGKRRKLRISQAPDPGSELYWCCCGMWMGL